MPLNTCLVWLVMAAILTTGARAQTIELKSARLGVLEGTERERFLAAHNAARKVVGVDPVSWSDELGTYAVQSLEQQKDALIEAAKEGWAEGRVALPKHRDDAEYGENVAGWAGSKGRSAEFAAELWLSERAAFEKLITDDSYRVGDEEGRTEIDDNGRERPVVVGHYTAIVWRATKQIGASKLEFELTDGCTNRTYASIICNYNPPGNRRGEKPY
jgi:pathogenesis-related protein 1